MFGMILRHVVVFGVVFAFVAMSSVGFVEANGRTESFAALGSSSAIEGGDDFVARTSFLEALRAREETTNGTVHVPRRALQVRFRAREREREPGTAMTVGSTLIF